MPIAADVQLGQGVKIFHPDLVNLYGCAIGPDTKIGTFVEVQKNAVIGAVVSDLRPPRLAEVQRRSGRGRRGSGPRRIPLAPCRASCIWPAAGSV